MREEGDFAGPVASQKTAKLAIIDNISGHMDDAYKREIIKRMLSRAETGLYFLQDFLYQHSANDGAYFRSLCILLSYNFELVLKTGIVIISQANTKEKLDEELRKGRHNLQSIASTLGTDYLKRIGIKSLIPRRTSAFAGYTIKTTGDKEIIIEDLNVIRYDFLHDGLRGLPPADEFPRWVDEVLAIVSRIRHILAS